MLVYAVSKQVNREESTFRFVGKHCCITGPGDKNLGTASSINEWYEQTRYHNATFSIYNEEREHASSVVS